MIKTVAEFLRDLMEKERQVLDAVELKHAPTIGDMYEGLSQEVLGRAIPPGLGLRIVSGFVSDGQDQLSGQMDYMLVRGEGVPIPHTSDFIWHIKDVIAVFEIKKTLYAVEMKEAFQHLNELRTIEKSYNQSHHDPVDIHSTLRAFAETTMTVAPTSESIETLPYHLQVIFHTLAAEHLGTLRIVIGYHGSNRSTTSAKRSTSTSKMASAVQASASIAFPR
ncbi:MAG: DUF6602 domain-containing protein [Nocardioidaceae bacterium]